MRVRHLLALIVVIVGSIVAAPPAKAQCSVPDELVNNTTADATQVGANFQALLGCINGSVAIHHSAVVWCSTCTVAVDTLPVLVPQESGTIQSITYLTHGSSSPNFTASVQIAGANITGCSNVTVSSTSPTTTPCTGNNTFTNGQLITVVTSSVVGLPGDAMVQINWTLP
jgi:hypothetical protein